MKLFQSLDYIKTTTWREKAEMAHELGLKILYMIPSLRKDGYRKYNPEYDRMKVENQNSTEFTWQTTQRNVKIQLSNVNAAKRIRAKK